MEFTDTQTTCKCTHLTQFFIGSILKPVTTDPTKSTVTKEEFERRFVESFLLYTVIALDLFMLVGILFGFKLDADEKLARELLRQQLEGYDQPDTLKED